MESSISSDNMKLTKVAGIGVANLGKLKNKYGITNHYEIIQHFKAIEDDIWRDSQSDPNTKEFIDKLIYVIHDEICNPGREDAKIEKEKANELVEKLEEFIQEKKGKSGKEKSHNQTIGETVGGLKTKVGNPELFDTFLCCLLMSDSSKAHFFGGVSKEIKAHFFGGVFKIWGWLQKLHQADEEKLKKFFENTKEYINREDRSRQVAEGFKKLKGFINEAENRNLLMDNLDSICQKYEAIIKTFYRWISISEIQDRYFSCCYVSVKKHLPNFQQYTSIINSANRNLNNHAQWQFEYFQKKQYRAIERSKQVTPSDTTVKSSPEKLKCLQINLNRSEKAWNQLIQWLKAEKTKDEKPVCVHVVFIQEPYYTRSKNVCCYFPNLPKNYKVVHNNYFINKDEKGGVGYISAILVRNDVPFESIFPIAAEYDNYKYPQELTVGIRLTGQGWDGVTLYSIYCRPIRSLALVLKPLRSLDNHSQTVLCMDANATHPSWGPDHQDKNLYSGRGEDLEDFRMSCKLEVANIKDDTEDNKMGPIPKHIDVTLYGANLCISKWRRLQKDSFSDHRYITFSIRKSSEEGNMSCLGRNTTKDL